MHSERGEEDAPVFSHCGTTYIQVFDKILLIPPPFPQKSRFSTHVFVFFFSEIVTVTVTGSFWELLEYGGGI